MKPRSTFNHAAKGLLSLTLLFVCPLLLPAQSKDKKSNPPPPPPPQQQQQQPQRQQPPPQQQQQQRPVQQPQHAGPRGTGPGPVKPGTGPATAKPATGPITAKSGTGPTTPKSRTGAATVKPAGIAKPTTVNLPNGGKSVTTSQGHKLEFNKSGQLSNVVTNKGVAAHFDDRGKVKTITTANGTTITHPPGGERRIETVRHDPINHSDTRIVSTGSNRGFLERRSVDRAGNPYMRRTYVYGGQTYVAIYRGYRYNGVVYYHYVPAYYYRPAFYAWGYSPWGAPVVYTGWGWYGAPWYGWSGYYFAPFPVYPSAAFWLTDYLIAENLEAAYEAQAAANTPALDESQTAQSQSNTVVLSPDVKQMIAEEVKAQLAAEQSAAAEINSSTTAATLAPQPGANTEQAPPALDPNLRVFIVTTSLDVTASGQACSLSPGDVLMRTENTPDKDNTVGVSVVSSQKSDCAGGSSLRLQVADLQEMHNHFREQLDNGLKTLADNQGKNGIPSGPVGKATDNPDFKNLPHERDLTITADLRKQREDADQTEKDIQQASSAHSAAGNR